MNHIDLEGKRAIITGGAQGIGLATAERFIESGAEVILWDINADMLDKAVAELGEKASGRVVELTEEDAVTEAARQAGAIDILVNNAGITGGNGKTWELAPDVWRRTVEVNLVAPYLTCRALIPGMIERGYGRIVNIASIAGKEGNPNASHYSASKAGLIGLTKSLGKELAKTGVVVNCLTPAAARTPIFDQMSQEHIDYMLSKIPLERFLEPAEAAAMIAWLASAECSFTTGGVFDISGGRAVY
ncbi:SDR family oxidoreductase [Nitratireductor aquimarinus]|uniref:SDR family NAD(P)-dependent oxidoreductase n=1 Tax=Nitratireductor TaxID=245876 RepID=UPI0019D35C48|nr:MULTISPECIES: SDR family NAD(P)-dependent oxidoreductase [Nitratireductor]MBN7776162.1 SDR family oxidoreductase [Nitratireductor pacificus]MBN7779029.1 SDR family oxidoreductase [Nitratireductor pacificus]MBN7787836.1 SDR family oxidoreductase [Nitratireductor aquimarinus]MBY6097883.1 SDR family oxidoreductase [Nitratireductor aquimarinus]MCA1260360.1 SDR family oxidoreductase [Nitratireductor aquimarinus]